MFDTTENMLDDVINNNHAKRCEILRQMDSMYSEGENYTRVVNSDGEELELVEFEDGSFATFRQIDCQPVLVNSYSNKTHLPEEYLQES